VQLEDLVPGVRVSGVLPGVVSIIAVHPYGDSAVAVTFKDSDGEVGQQILYRADEAKLGLAQSSQLSSLTLENSEALAVTSVASYRSAWPAISRS
jgi:hypothetical protein